MAYRQRNRRTRLAPAQIDDSAEAAEVFVRYFLSIGLHNESARHGTPANRAAFRVKFGRPEYRREAWLQVRDALRELIPGWVFEELDQHFTHGTALGFTKAFDLDTCRRMRAAVTSN